MKNIYTQDIKNGKIDFELLHEMEQEILKLKDIVLEDLPGDEYFEFNNYLNNLVKLQDEKGFFPLVIDPSMPNDCTYHYVKKPTYIILKCLIEYNNPLYYDAIDKTLEICKKTRFCGHGYDSEIEQVENILMLLKVNFLDFCDEELQEIVYEIIDDLRKYVSKKIKQNQFDTIDSNIIELINFVDQNKYVFYGTLRKDEIAHEKIEDEFYIGNVILNNTGMINKNGLMSIEEKENTIVTAELYDLDETTAKQIDEYEGNNYSKKRIWVNCNEYAFYPNVYLFNTCIKDLSDYKF